MLEGLCASCIQRLALLTEEQETQDATVIVQASPSAEKQASLDSFEDYEIIEFIARGGMGAVYRARQRSLNREVALKMVLSGHFAGEEEKMRFRAEAEAAARLDHPNIVPIYEVGEHEGRPFFSMRLIEGRDLSDVLASESGKRMTARDAAALVAKVARAVHYAHQRGLIHRDLKPANILMDAQGEPHITDFGLAKEIEGATGMTLSGAVVGTPGYMAPEQAAGKVHGLTTAVDVFALGAVLYHLLARRQPFKGENAVETLRQVLEADPAPMTACGVRIDRDLETICLRCLEKDPAQRFGSAEALAEDLERWLRGETILARPSTFIGRTVKWAKRRPAIAALGALAALFLILGMAGIFWQWRRADEMLALAQENEQQAKKNRDKAEKLLDFLLGDLRVKLRTKATLGILRDVEDKVADYYRDMEVTGDDTEQVLRRLRALGASGNNEDMAGDKVEAEKRIRASLSGVIEVAAREPENIKARENLGMVRFSLGRLLDQRGDLDGAEKEYRAALAVLEQLIAQPGGNLGWERAAAGISDQLADILIMKGELDEAGAILTQTHRSMDQILAQNPAHYDARYKKILLCRSTAELAKRLGHDKETESWLRQGLALSKALAADEPDDLLVKFELVTASSNLGDLLLVHGDTAGARKELEFSFSHSAALAAHDPDYAVWQEAHASNCKRMAEVLELTGDHTAAEQHYRMALEIREKLAALDSSHLSARRNLGLACVALGDFLLEAGRWQETGELYERALTIREELLAREPANHEFQFDLSRVCERLMRVRLEEGVPDEAEALARRARDITLNLASSSPGNVEWVRQSGMHARLLADILRAKGGLEEAMSHYDEAMAIFHRLITARHDDLESLHGKSVVLDRLGSIAQQEKNYAQARKHFEECRRIHQELVAQAPEKSRWQRELAISSGNLGDVELAEGRLDKAGSLYREALEIREKILHRIPGSATAHLGLAIACYKLAGLHGQTAQFSDAVTLVKRALKIAEELDAAGRLSSKEKKWIQSFRQSLAYHEKKLGASN